jgi:hypothetical protein
MLRRPPIRLSRPHSEPLLLARRLRRSNTTRAADDRRELLRYWYGSGAARLHAEEHVLLQAWERHGGADHPLNAATRADLTRLGEAVEAVAADPHTSHVTLREIGRRLSDHVLRQERELSGAVERAVPPDELATVRGDLHNLARG